MKYLWVFLTACLVGIIYYNSSLPLKQSSEISGWFAALTQLLAQHLDIRLTGDVEHHIRKLAHFCEFALLGLLLCHSFSALACRIAQQPAISSFWLCSRRCWTNISKAFRRDVPAG